MSAPGAFGASGYSKKHSVDALFARDVAGKGAPLAPSWTKVRAPDTADLFVLPVLCSQAGAGFCGPFGDVFEDALKHLPHLKKGKRNHLVVCDDPQVCNVKWPPEFIVGCFEAGYTHKLEDAALLDRQIAVGAWALRCLLSRTSKNTEKWDLLI